MTKQKPYLAVPERGRRRSRQDQALLQDGPRHLRTVSEGRHWQTFTEGSTLVPGIQAVKANGHTPGHTAFADESEGQKLLIWGDLVHAHTCSSPNRAYSSSSTLTRNRPSPPARASLKPWQSVRHWWPACTYPFPGIGHVRWECKESYSWVPIEFSPLPKP